MIYLFYFDMSEKLLAILKAGGAYQPFDPDYPTEGLAYRHHNIEMELVRLMKSATQRRRMDKRRANVQDQ